MMMMMMNLGPLGVNIDDGNNQETQEDKEKNSQMRHNKIPL